MSYLGNSPGVASQRVETALTATSSQTVFTPSSGYTLGYCDVYQNGVKLVNGDDYTAADGATITLATGAASGDSIVIVASFPRGLSDGYLKSEADAKYLTIASPSYTGTLTGGTGAITIGTTHFVKDSSGNVGIGVANPLAKLHVSGGSTFMTGPSSGAFGLYLYTTRASSSARSWALRTNENAEGDFVVLRSTTNADAPSVTSFAISSGGNVGIGTASPLTKATIATSSGNTALTFQQTNGSTRNWLVGCQYNINQSFEITPSTSDGGSTFSAPALVINTSGQVGIGVISPGVLLDLSGNSLDVSNVTSPSVFGLRANLQPSLVASGNNLSTLNDARSLGVRCRYTSGSTNYPSSYGVVHAYQHYGSGEIGSGSQYITQMAFSHNDTPLIYLRNSNTSNGTSFSNWYTINTTSVSDERAKKNIVDAPDQLGILTQLEVKNFEYINENEPGVQLGMIAQQVDSVDPYYVSKDLENPDLMWRVHYDKMVPMLVKAIQEQQAIIEQLRADVETLKGAQA